VFFVKQKTNKLTGGFLRLFNKTKESIKQPVPDDVNQQLLLQLNKKKIPSWSQIKQLSKILQKSEKIKLLIILLIFLVSASALGWRFYWRSSVEVPAIGGSYTEGLIGAPQFVNPILANTDVDRDLVRLVFSGLVKLNSNGEIIPDLATGYTIDAEQTTYTFELKPDIKWHDGHPLTADDVIFTIERITDPDFKSPLKNSFSGVEVNRINDRTVQFKLAKPFTPFLSIMTTGIIPEHLWYSVPSFSAALTDLNIKPVGSGPYKFKSLTKDTNGNIKNYNLEIFEDYHLDNAYIENLSFKFYEDFMTGVTALQNKNVEGLTYLPEENKDQIKNKKIDLRNLHYPQYTAVFFNPNNNDILSSNDFRKALALSVDKQRILTEVLNNNGQIIHTPILPGMTGYDESIKNPDFNTVGAAAILDDLGWILSEDNQFRTKTTKATDDDEEDQVEELTIKLTTIDQSASVKIVSIIKENWEAIGIKTTLDIVPKDKIKKDVIDARQYEALVFGELINVNSGPYPFWHSSQNEQPGLNLSVIANKDIDEYLELARSAKTTQAKIEPLTNFQNKLLELNFAIFLYNPTYTYPTASKIKGLETLQFINLPADRFNNINSWYIKTKRVLND
jgi:peptide/nickel transport system substrate-binding protein